MKRGPKPPHIKYKPKFGYFLTIGMDPKGRGLLATLSDGSPQYGHRPVKVLDLAILPSREACRDWMQCAINQQAWMSYND